MGLSKSGLIAHFGTKETLQLSVLQAAAQLFADRVLIPARLEWPTSQDLPGGCLFVTATTELDDRPGVLRFFLNKVQKEWIDVVQGAVREAKELGEFGAELDTAKFAFNMFAIFQAFHAYASLLNDRTAEGRARASFEGLVRRAKGEYQPVTPEAKRAENPSTARPRPPAGTEPTAAS